MEFSIRVALSFLVGGAYVSGIIWVAEKLGPRIGGALAGTPSAILVGLAFINLTAGPAQAKAGTTLIPLGIVAAFVYALVFVQVAGKLKSRFAVEATVLISSFVWFILALIIHKIFAGKPFIIIAMAMLAGCAIFQYVYRNFEAREPKKVPSTRTTYVLRFLVGGTVIASSVIVARLVGPVWGGMVTTFPATLGTTLYFLTKSQGVLFTRGFVRHLPASFISSLVFVSLLYVTLTRIPSLLAFILAMTTCLLYSYLLVSRKH
jgi:hypothetical protein